MAESISMVDKAIKRQLSWYRFIQLFRAIMQNRKTVTRTICITFIFTNPALALGAEAFVNWLTDITDLTLTQVVCETAWNLAELDLPLGVDAGATLISNVEVFKELLPKLYKAFKDSKI
ncbi:hypothetical protein MMC29_000685 [Sticta canariensis]|nr:hypothetical protein [Sticta canariensis]